MFTIEFPIRRMCVVSSQPFDDIVRNLTAAIGRPDMTAFHQAIGTAAAMEELEALVQTAIGSSGLMEFARYNAGDILRKERGPAAPQILRLVVGNPLVMKEMVKLVPDAASYAPTTILIDQRTDGVHISYDYMAGFIAPYGSPAALLVAQQLDRKIEALIESTAR